MQDMTIIQWHNKIMQDEMHALQTEHVLFEELHAKMEIELQERMDEMDKTINGSYALYDERHDYHKLISGSDLVPNLPLSCHESSSLWFTKAKRVSFMLTSHFPVNPLSFTYLGLSLIYFELYLHSSLSLCQTYALLMFNSESQMQLRRSM